MWFEIILVFILFKFKKHSNISGIRNVESNTSILYIIKYILYREEYAVFYTFDRPFACN